MRYCRETFLVGSLKQDLLASVGSRSWRSRLAAEVWLWQRRCPSLGSVSKGEVIEYVCGVVDGSVKSSSDVLLFDSLDWLDDNCFGDLDDFCSEFVRFVLAGLGSCGSAGSCKWASVNVRRNARNKLLSKKCFESKKASLFETDFDQVPLSLMQGVDGSSFRLLVEELAKVSGESLSVCAGFVLFHSYGFTHNDLSSQLPNQFGSVNRSQLEYLFQKISKSHRNL